MRSVSVRALGAFLLVASPLAAADPVTLTIDPARSVLNIAECSFQQVRNGLVLASAPLSAQGSAPCSGAITLTVDASAPAPMFKIESAGSISLAVTGAWEPSARASDGSGVGGSGAFPGNFGLTGTANAIPIKASVVDLALSVSGAPTALAGEAFTFEKLGFTLTGGQLAYRAPAGGVIGTIRGGGPLAGTAGASRPSSGSLKNANGVTTLTLPIDATFTIASQNAQGTATATVRVTGTITASGPVAR